MSAKSAPRKGRGGRRPTDPTDPHRPYVTGRVPTQHRRHYEREADAMGLPLTDYLCLIMARGSGLPLPQYLVDQLEQIKQERPEDLQAPLLEAS